MSKENDRTEMEEIEKIDKLRQRADVSYEEARDALRACDGDLLDAMVYLERRGQAKAPEQPTFSTNAEEKQSYENVPEAVVRSQDDKSDPSFGEQLIHLLKTAFRKSVDNSLVVSHRNEEKFRLPILVVVLLFLVFNFAAVAALVISLFFDVKYQFVGKDDLSGVNRVINEAGTKASDWMHDSYRRENDAQRQAERAARREEERAAWEARRESDRAEREARRESDRAEREVRRESDRAEREVRRESDRAEREVRRTEDKVAREIRKAEDKAAREIQKAKDKAAREVQKAKDKAARVTGNTDTPEDNIDTSVREETFAEKEMKDLQKKYDAADTNEPDNKE
ncbi:MAG: hypothetical protein IJM25_03990 [Eubacterium sp.]|nr:hypothetical protein [Eubacterium sp.]